MAGREKKKKGKKREEKGRGKRKNPVRSRFDLLRKESHSGKEGGKGKKRGRMTGLFSS